MLGGGGGSGAPQFLKVVQEEDVVGDRSLGDEICFLFFYGGDQVGRGGLSSEDVKQFIHCFVVCFICRMFPERYLPVVGKDD